MKTITGIFPNFANAENALTALRARGFDESQLTILTPETPESQIHSVPMTEGEHAGEGRALGGLVGGAGGLALAAFVIPGVGPILAAGMAAAGIIGGAVGVAAGGAIEDASTEGIDADDVFPIEHALRAGRTSVIIEARDGAQFDQARGIIRDAGGDELRAVRDHWWHEQRSKEHQYSGDALADEPAFRRGFEAALTPAARGKGFEQCRAELQKRNAEHLDAAAFRRGFERGQAFHQQLQQERPGKAA